MIKAGDIVTLKSGGPKMTVEKLSFSKKKAELKYYNDVDNYFDWQVIAVAALQVV